MMVKLLPVSTAASMLSQPKYACKCISKLSEYRCVASGSHLQRLEIFDYPSLKISKRHTNFQIDVNKLQYSVTKIVYKFIFYFRLPLRI